MRSIKNKSTEENREFWSHVETVAQHVRSCPSYSNYKITDKTRSSSQGAERESKLPDEAEPKKD